MTPQTPSERPKRAPFTPLRPLTLSALLLAPLLTACDAASVAQRALTAGSEGSAAPCEAPQGECYRDGWRVEGELMWVEVERARPSAPSRGLNTWEVRVGLTAAPEVEGGLDGCALSAAPYMPDHMHGSNTATVSALGEGRYSIGDFDLIMPGYWELPVRVSCPAASGTLDETLTFGFWLEG
jgi:hypothetical protein